MGFYSKYVLPRVIDLACGTDIMMRQRARIVPHAAGKVVEIGVGTGLNLDWYDEERVERLMGIDPCATSLMMAHDRAMASSVPITLEQGSAEALPCPANWADTVVSTYTLCTVPHPQVALAEIHRVLKPGGNFLFCEHVASPDRRISAWQNRLNGVWGCCFGGCNINRNLTRMICDAGFDQVEHVSDDVAGEIAFVRHQAIGWARKPGKASQVVDGAAFAEAR
ncbi:SAM-dependent methyltransferase [Bosea caraganae]|uniref:SAM-dependent methyltransferase n=1 Tax=Bosea caraganae TaxID=2763117 RepID=A0A370LB26_9HYPH|nr:class I SAM-dependent methyltransferase [Bosea caraganae]RDJ21863.1 SAM-dependent methyltransferase [Bosea caraganae]RDJ28106.1 SAM-dependent methyltransferase [Bosea caraganae]